MKKETHRVLWFAWMMLVSALPAYANNPPAPDGMLSLVLIFPVAMLGYRFAGAQRTEKENKRRVLKGLVLALAFLLTMGGTEIAIIPLLVLLYYGVRRGVMAIVRGQGWKRIALGTLMILFTFFGVANYLASLNNYPSEQREDLTAVGRLRQIVAAEHQFRSDAVLDADKNGVPEYGSLEQLVATNLSSAYDYAPPKRGGPRFTLVLTGDPARDEKEFFVYATPTHYGAPRRTISLLDGSRPRVSRRTFATDETGVIRSADLGTARPVTREEAEKWPPVE